ncbi:tRNA (guanine-N(7)-)-methyltransferase non-catalytic subunit trm82 [Penicillium capsulatum]|uniref:tRNA (Guanine-N(7)-)-methyltransferase non-catalytic subunit trm82 n=1 Tax=Penicillium capsulatum TaxID=69766 RepID=A0A9W9IK29_9EURO|nr:tRNA (guanine-N(7)-)-methyltransferase non-catalytic subunit trm82 [Penicillium capsulatum]
MPKRPSALALSPDGQSILSGDKFGDAYSMPLIPGEYVKAPRAQPKASNPAATSLTVHTKRNLSSLEQQLRQAQQNTKSAEEKDSLNFEHQLILGHVSMLMDLVSASLPAETGSRSYVLTADRDEHIRVSRGIPQSHVIEQQCLGHTSVISKLCIPSWASEILISGDGDGNLFVWNWSKGQAYQQISLGETLRTDEATVRGIWAVALGQVKLVLVSLEGSSQLLYFTFEQDGTLKFQNTIKLSGNALEVACVESRESILVSVDGVREPDSTNTWRSNTEGPQALLESFNVKTSQGDLEIVSSEDPLAVGVNSVGTSNLSASLDVKQKEALDSSLYSLENLKKKSVEE